MTFINIASLVLAAIAVYGVYGVVQAFRQMARLKSRRRGNNLAHM